jgi:hypothetical protein
VFSYCYRLGCDFSGLHLRNYAARNNKSLWNPQTSYDLLTCLECHGQIGAHVVHHVSYKFNKYNGINLGFVSLCIIIHSNKSTNQMHQSFRFIARRSNTAHRPQPTTLLPPCSNGKPEAATAVYRLMMMGKRMPETCWDVFEPQAINLRDWCIWLVDLFEWIMV